MFIYNLDTDWLKYENDGTASYYGYAVPGTPEDSTGWSIRKVTGTAPSIDVDWSNNARLSYISKWDERVAYFTDLGLSASPISLTYSVEQQNNSFNITTSLIKLEWGDVPGVDWYTVTFKDQNNVTYNSLFAPFVNAYVYTPYTTHVPSVPVSGGTVSYVFRGKPGMTYSVSLVGDNKYQDPPYTAPVATIVT